MSIAVPAPLARFASAAVLCIAGWTTAASADDWPADTDALHAIHVVQPGETLSDISHRWYWAATGPLPVIAWYNGLDDPERLRPGQRLELPTENGLLAKVGLRTSRPSERPNFEVRLHGRTGDAHVLLQLCLDPPDEDDRCFPHRVVVRLGPGGTAEKTFDQRDVFDLGDDWNIEQVGTFEMVDLDGDGDVDLVGEWTQGSAVRAQIFAFHWRSGAYRVVKLWNGWLADRSAHRGEDGRLVFVFEHRRDCWAEEDAETNCPDEDPDVVPWDPAMETATELDWPFR